ncbi:Urea active transporter [Colletotrichum gloeosporioides]|uniref:Urea active transporter n=1 Tax=Colletotrichum gloeosporioides TaxID=474922 RepID=A0A8H4FRT1_COLGL|nr:Urea active transporter [Colletotrichum gloeosporioides]KAF3812208.1 Urea active transporter [Colletotrichum gloeosporioides]
MSVQLGVSGETLIPQSTGYGMLIGLGIGFCGVILAAVKIQKAYLAEDSGTSEMFMVANRSVGTGLTASAVFSSWMWINETVFSAAFCYKFGLAVPFWWSTGLCFQIALMAALGVLAKIRVPYAHTSLEIIRMRYGWIGHIVFIVLNITNNVFGCAGMILTGSQLIYGISGMHFVAATILIPLGVVLYTAVGGLKATFITDYLHTLIALVLIIYFTLKVLTHDAVGGLGGLYDKVVATASENMIDGNYKGSLLTMKSRDAIIWGLILKFGNLALVVMDTAFWQKSFATEVNATVPGYNLAAAAIFGIPWGLGTVIGLTARALHNTPIWPAYPQEFTLAQVNAGLVMPYTVKALIGDQGIDAFLVLVFMALTSTVSSSMIAVSSILSFDVYKTYINPKASDKKLVHVSHLTVVFHAVFITAISLALNYGGADMTWIGYFRPILSCPGIIPLGLTLCWSGQTRLAAIVSPILGFLTGLGIWLGTAHVIYGEINMKTTEGSLPALYGATASFFSPALYSVLLSQYKPEKFDWRRFLLTEIAEEVQMKQSTDAEKDTDDGNNSSTSESQRPAPSLLGPEKASDPERTAATAGNEKAPAAVFSRDAILNGEVNLDDVRHPFDEDTIKLLYKWYRIAWYMFVGIVLITFILWPMPLYRDYIFEKTFFKSWTTVAIIWQFFAFFAVVVYPLYDGRYEIARGAKVEIQHNVLSELLSTSSPCVFALFVPEWGVCSHGNDPVNAVYDIQRTEVYTRGFNGSRGTFVSGKVHRESDHVSFPLKTNISCRTIEELKSRFPAAMDWALKDLERTQLHRYHQIFPRAPDDDVGKHMAHGGLVFGEYDPAEQHKPEHPPVQTAETQMCELPRHLMFHSVPKDPWFRLRLRRNPEAKIGFGMRFFVEAGASMLQVDWSVMPQLETVFLDLRSYGRRYRGSRGKPEDDGIRRGAAEMSRCLRLQDLVIAGLRSGCKYVRPPGWQLCDWEVDEWEVDGEVNWVKVFCGAVREGGRLVFIDRRVLDVDWGMWRVRAQIQGLLPKDRSKDNGGMTCLAHVDKAMGPKNTNN